MKKYITTYMVDQLQLASVPRGLLNLKIYPREILSSNSILVYHYLYERMGISRTRGWFDQETGRIYCYFTQKKLVEKTGLSERTVRACLKELENCDLVERAKQGRNKPDRLFLLQVNTPSDGSGMPSLDEEEWIEEENATYLESPTETWTGKNCRPEIPKSDKGGASPTDTRTGKNCRPENIVTGENDRPEIPKNDNEGASPTDTRTGNFCRMTKVPAKIAAEKDIKDLSSLSFKEKDLKDIKDIGPKDSPQGGNIVQGLLINMPTSKTKPSSKRADYTKPQWSEIKIQAARESGNWEKVTDENFTYYYKKIHSEAGLRELVVDPLKDITRMRVFIKEHELPREKVCDYLDHIIKQYKNHPANKINLLAYSAFAHGIVIELVQRAKADLEPVEQKYSRNKFENKVKAPIGEYEVF